MFNKIKLLLILFCMFFLGCESDYSIIKRNGIIKNKERLQSNIPIIPTCFDLTIRSTGSQSYLFCHSPDNKALNNYCMRIKS